MSQGLAIVKVSAYEYYGPHASGTLVLINGVPSFQGTKKEAEAYYNRLISCITNLNPESRLVSDHTDG